MYEISNNVVYSKMIDNLQEIFELDREEVIDYVTDFLKSFTMKDIIATKLIELEVPTECFI